MHLLKKIDDYGMTPLSLHFLTMTNYDDSFKNLNIIYKKENLKDTLGEILSKNGKKQLRIAETEKYPHVTFSSTVAEKNHLKMKIEFYVHHQKFQHMI